MDLLFFSVKSLWISSLAPLIILLFYYYYQNPAKNPLVPIYLLLGIPTVLFIKNRRRLIERTTEILVSRRPIHAITVNGSVTASPWNIKLMLKTFFAPSYPRPGNSNRPFPLLQDLLSLEFNQRSLCNFAIDTANKTVARLIPLLTQAAAENDIIDLQAVLEIVGFDNICKVAFGKDLLTSSKHNPEELLHDNVTSFITAGRKATSSALTWFFWNLPSRPDMVKRILEEVKLMRAVTNRNINRSYSFNELRKMKYLDAAVSETLRLYQPVPVDTQWRREGYITPDGSFIGNDWAMTFCISKMRRMEKIWEDPMEFRPERFLQDTVSWHEWQYGPFHGDPRMRTGMEMVYIQMKSITASVLERFEITAVKKKKNPQPLFSMTLRMRGGLPVRVKERA